MFLDLTKLKEKLGTKFKSKDPTRVVKFFERTRLLRLEGLEPETEDGLKAPLRHADHQAAGSSHLGDLSKGLDASDEASPSRCPGGQSSCPSSGQGGPPFEAQTRFKSCRFEGRRLRVRRELRLQDRQLAHGTDDQVDLSILILGSIKVNFLRSQCGNFGPSLLRLIILRKSVKVCNIDNLEKNTIIFISMQ